MQSPKWGSVKVEIQPVLYGHERGSYGKISVIQVNQQCFLLYSPFQQIKYREVNDGG